MSTLVHVTRQPIEPGDRPPVLILLHGLYSNEHDLFALAPYLDERFLIVSPRAPYTLTPGDYAWFNLSTDGQQFDMNLARVAVRSRQSTVVSRQSTPD